MTDEARAVAEVAKTTGEVVKAAGGLGAYLARVFGSIPDDTLGLVVGDWLSNKRRRHLAVLEANTARMLERINAERLSEISPSVLIPLLEAAVNEGREELQALWANLLANAMVDGGERVRRDFFEVVRQLEPSDATVLDIVARRLNATQTTEVAMNEDRTFIETERARLSISPDELAVAMAKLIRLGCVLPMNVIARVLMGAPMVPGDEVPSLTPFGRRLVAAIKPP